ncbi:MAG TPA: TIGR03617 family F420-dependent LLM class oxidoreductase [Chloroflexota bacterium]|nr:TIGR03617 family F420-dependent LLM class oxidoreductase [Chloroflexota bacterium]
MDLKLDAILPAGIVAAREAAGHLESLGFDGLWALETQSDPFQDLGCVTDQTETTRLGTGVAIAFARSPFLTAVDAWQLQAASRGRFVLGLGTEIKGHIERRFGMPWDSPGPKLREYVAAVRALWRAFQGEERLNFRGNFYNHTLLVPFFNPGPIDYPAPPIYLAAVNPYNCLTVGLSADGIIVHPVHSNAYLESVVLPRIQKGLERSDRTRADIDVVCMTLVIAGEGKDRQRSEDFARSYIAFQGAARTYAPVFEHHGWGDLPAQLHAKMAAGDIPGMTALVTHEMVEAVAVTGRDEEEVAENLRKRYSGLADRVIIFNLDSLPWAGDDARMARFVDLVQGGMVPVG